MVRLIWSRPVSLADCNIEERRSVVVVVLWPWPCFRDGCVMVVFAVVRSMVIRVRDVLTWVRSRVSDVVDLRVCFCVFWPLSRNLQCYFFWFSLFSGLNFVLYHGCPVGCH